MSLETLDSRAVKRLWACRNDNLREHVKATQFVANCPLDAADVPHELQESQNICKP